jgi:hypothetical protein
VKLAEERLSKAKSSTLIVDEYTSYLKETRKVADVLQSYYENEDKYMGVEERHRFLPFRKIKFSSFFERKRS